MAKRTDRKTTTDPLAGVPMLSQTGRRKRVRLVSTDSAIQLWCHAFVDVLKEHGMPLDPAGNAMVIGTAQHGLSAEAREQRDAAKLAEKARIAAMSDDEKLAYAREKREARKAKRTAKKSAERDALIAQIKAEIKAGNISLDD